MRNFFLKHFLRLQSAIHLMKMESTVVEIFRKEKTAVFEADFNRTKPIEEKKLQKNEDTSVEIYSHIFLRQFMPETAIFCARNP